MKTCTICKNEKSLKDFYYYRGKYLTACKPCRRYKYQEQNLEYKARKLVYDRAYHKKRRETSKDHINSHREYREKYPEKWRAQYLLRSAVRNGRVIKLPCIECGEKKVNGHHYDYSKPLKVIWLCPTHHRRLHVKMASRSGVA